MCIQSVLCQKNKYILKNKSDIEIKTLPQDLISSRYLLDVINVQQLLLAIYTPPKGQ